MSLINSIINLHKYIAGDAYIRVTRDFVFVDFETFFRIVRAYHGNSNDTDKVKIAVHDHSASLSTVIEGKTIKVVI